MVGNRLKKEEDAGNNGSQSFTADETTTYTYDRNDRVLNEVNTGATSTNTVYEYGPGNSGTAQTSETVKSGTTIGQGATQKTQVFEYNLQGKLKTATTTESGTTTVSQYEYDDQGFRITQTETVNGGPANVTRYVVDAQNPTGYTQVLEERNATGQVVKTYTLGMDVITQAAAGAVYHLLYDAHGSTRALASGATTNAVQFYTYDAYGKLINLSGFVSELESAFTSLLYSGEWRDKATGWDNLRARWMRDGRFNSLDPFAGDFANPLTLHKYGFTPDDPVNHNDPNGEFWGILLALAGAGAVFGALSTVAANYSLGHPLTRGRKRGHSTFSV